MVKTTSVHRPLLLIPPIHRATHRIGLYIAQLSELGVTQPEAHVLDHLATHGASTVGGLHQVFAHRRSTLTSVLDRLTDRGFVTREPSADDRRTFVIELTGNGKTVATRLHRELQRIEGRALKPIAKRDLEGFTRVLASIERALVQSDD